MALTRKDAAVEHADVVVLGGGPAGLAAAVTASRAGRRVVLLEMGNDSKHRIRDSSDDIVTGVGGAGLFSDGKFSFFPSASRLWRLPDQAALRSAYGWFADLLSDFAEIPTFPVISPSVRKSAEARELKTYPSIYLDFDTRLSILDSLTTTLGASIVSGAIVEQVIHAPDGRMSIAYRQRNETAEITADAVVLAFGRLGGLYFNNPFPWLETTFRRYEFGVRLESPAAGFFLQDHKCLDPKFILRNPGVPGIEWRTFCTCRNGEVVETNFRGLRSYSGRSDVAHTGFSNVGFNVRITADPDHRSELLHEIQKTLDGKTDSFRIGLRDYVSGAGVGYGPKLDTLMRAGLKLLLEQSDEDFTVVGPCVEGIGNYPVVDENLRIPGAPVWVAGDQTGLFRGLTSAFLSGHYVATQAYRSLPAPHDLRAKAASTRKVKALSGS